MSAELSWIEDLVVDVDRRMSMEGEHSHNVAQCALDIARVLGVDEDGQALVVMAAHMHDIGKVVVPDRILLKPSCLEAEEMELVKLHPQIGYVLLSAKPEYKACSALVLAHHEQADGSGYPKGLKAEEIDPLAQIVAIADSLDAMMTTRVYRVVRSLRYTCEELLRGRGRQWTDEVTDAALSVLKQSQATHHAIF